jgi:hypothetical protein
MLKVLQAGDTMMHALHTLTKRTTLLAALLISSFVLSACGSETVTPSQTATQPAPTASPSEPGSVFDPNTPPLQVPDELAATVKEQIRTGAVQNDPRTGKPVPQELLTFMKLLNDTNVYVVEAQITDAAELTAAYKRIWDWAAASGLGLYAVPTLEEEEAGIDPTDPTPATYLNIVTLDGTNYCAIDIRYLGEKVEPSNLIRQSLLTMACAELASGDTE